MTEDTTRRLAEIRAVLEGEPWELTSEDIAEVFDHIDALTAGRDARCGNCGGDLRPVCVDCGTRHGYGWPDLPEPP